MFRVIVKLIYASSMNRKLVQKTWQKQPPKVFYEKDVLENFAKFIGKHLCQSLLFNKVAGWLATLLKKRLWHRSFRMNFAKFSRTPFYETPLDDCFWPNISKRIEKLPTNDNKYCLSKVHIDEAIHIISSYSKISSWSCLQIQHDVIAKYLYKAIRKTKDAECKIEYKGDEFIDQYNGTEYW